MLTFALAAGVEAGANASRAFIAVSRSEPAKRDTMVLVALLAMAGSGSERSATGTGTGTVGLSSSVECGILDMRCVGNG